MTDSGSEGTLGSQSADVQLCELRSRSVHTSQGHAVVGNQEGGPTKVMRISICRGLSSDALQSAGGQQILRTSPLLSKQRQAR